jgi:DNA-nicking Smr family endonuclease
MNKYQRTPEHIVDLHGFTLEEARVTITELCNSNEYLHVRIITGKGIHSENGPVLKDFIRSYLEKNNIQYTQSKIQDGGEGAFEVFLKR